MPKKRVGIWVSARNWQRLQLHARRRRITVSAVIEEALDKILEEEEKRRQRIEAVQVLGALNLPVGTPEELCEEACRLHLPCDDEELSPPPASSPSSASAPPGHSAETRFPRVPASR